MGVVLSSDVQKLIEERLQTGRYESADHLILEALESLRGRDDGLAADNSAWREELDRRYKDASEGNIEWVEGDDASRRLAKRHRASRSRLS